MNPADAHVDETQASALARFVADLTDQSIVNEAFGPLSVYGDVQAILLDRLAARWKKLRDGPDMQRVEQVHPCAWSARAEMAGVRRRRAALLRVEYARSHKAAARLDDSVRRSGPYIHVHLCPSHAGIAIGLKGRAADGCSQFFSS